MARRFCFAVLLLILAGAPGCKKRSTGDDIPDTGRVMPVPNETAENGWPLYKVAAEGFAIALPPDWKHVEVNPNTLDEVLAGITANNPGFANMGATVRQQALQGLKFFGFSPQALQTGAGTNVNVGHFPNAGLPPKQVVDLNLAHLKTTLKLNEIPKPVVRMTKFAAMDRVEFAPNVNGPDGRPLGLKMLMYFYVTDTDLFIITFTAGPGQNAQIDTIGAAICESFRPIKR